MAQDTPRDRDGLIFGKFLPPHAGHLYLAERALSRVERLTLAVCSLAREPIPGEQRVAWLRELVPAARVVHVTDENPSLPHEHARFWEIWTETLLRAAGRPDVLFTGEDYGDEMARRLGARHERVDRGHVPISGTALRGDPLAHWEFLPECVRPYYVRRVVLTGSESTGKTVLAAELAAHFGTVYSAEYGRAYVDARHGAALTFDDVEPIARGQIASEDAAARRANRVLFIDTDLVSTELYARHYYGTCPEWVAEQAHARLAHLYLLHHPDVPWVPDGAQRDRGERRDEMHALFRDALLRHGARWVDITGDWDERRARAIAAVDELVLESRRSTPN